MLWVGTRSLEARPLARNLSCVLITQAVASAQKSFRLFESNNPTLARFFGV